MDGNVQKMREALKQICDYAWAHGVWEVEAMAKAALAEPQRNCDVGTAQELYERFLQFCDKKTHCEECPLHKRGGLVNMCIVRWLQMPYEKGGAK